MAGYIVTDFQLSIKEGKLDDFKAIVSTMVGNNQSERAQHISLRIPYQRRWHRVSLT